MEATTVVSAAPVPWNKGKLTGGRRFGVRNRIKSQRMLWGECVPSCGFLSGQLYSEEATVPRR
ncbi:hypothetical protein LMG28138_05394 [Pararobbsia alpina]|uniref:Uncharacterized protein n=1 Tax=Pararobbsia alpina TaxID=621374 RepID=A0A6S7DF03_9BURK|nr:hypothetical protein LMG28138_05394 [Pararobbsia alpina]